MKNIYIFARACDLRLLDATKINRYLKANGYNIVNKPKDADAIKPKLSEEEISKRLDWSIKYLKRKGFDSLNAPHMNSFVFKKRYRT